LKKSGIDVVEHLPWIEITEQRSDVDIARRCIVLASLLQLHFGAPKELIAKYLKDNDLLDSVTSEENRLLQVDHDKLGEQEKNRFILGYRSNLGFSLGRWKTR
ncbi:DUF4272 domain-containing protein, partial [Vibrio splendidus]|uniref:DUF4272 domain-containing protein n=1 Tax=Vibrio splendidus TaxID=29497 RepID=UPI00105479BE